MFFRAISAARHALFRFYLNLGLWHSESTIRKFILQTFLNCLYLIALRYAFSSGAIQAPFVIAYAMEPDWDSLSPLEGSSEILPQPGPLLPAASNAAMEGTEMHVVEGSVGASASNPIPLDEDDAAVPDSGSKKRKIPEDLQDNFRKFEEIKRRKDITALLKHESAKIAEQVSKISARELPLALEEAKIGIKLEIQRDLPSYGVQIPKYNVLKDFLPHIKKILDSRGQEENLLNLRLLREELRISHLRDSILSKAFGPRW